ncbi:uncharacterized protein BJ171DRAFT_584861 [Polychytrium aggregatum]|uniref:uncharacterized protein n=1 Tax=Polychytrium aggregatum TaxID=110093 RepID=UPI0022FE12C2|nr:uncharacterized protein BJ171DRAFT_584861 [Polychytrium aggregatum]KAI9199814.1 hypothetical protein BJ171DRAFT_584861 [Polychytrium aggregatum]
MSKYLADAKLLLQKHAQDRAPSSSGPVASRATGPATTSLDSVVNKLVRAAVGGKAADVPDGDMEKYVVEMMMKEASAAKRKYEQRGAAAYFDQEKQSNLPKPNKRFLMNIIRSTDDHNKALLRSLEAETEAQRLGRTMGRSGESIEESPRSGAVRPTGHSGLHLSDVQAPSFSPERHKRRKHDSAHETVAVTENEPATVSTKPVLTHRGRGSVGSSRLDKYFQDDYNPRLDPDNFDDGNIDAYYDTVERLYEQGQAPKQSTEEERRHSEKKSKDKKAKDKKKKRKKEKDRKEGRSRTAKRSSKKSSRDSPSESESDGSS